MHTRTKVSYRLFRQANPLRKFFAHVKIYINTLWKAMVHPFEGGSLLDRMRPIEALESRYLLSAILYACDNNGELFTVNTSTGQTQNIGRMSTEMSDIAENSQGQLFGVDFNSDLYSVNPTTAATTEIGSLGTNVNSLVFSANGTLYAANTSLYTVNPTTGAATVVGSLGDWTSDGDLAFDDLGNLFLTTSQGDLIQVNTSTGSATDVGALGTSEMYGLAYGSDGVMYGLSNTTDQIFSINLSTGAATAISTFTGVNGVTGAASLPPSPANPIGTFFNASLLRHVFPTFAFTAPVTVTNAGDSTANYSVTIDYYLSNSQRIRAHNSPLVELTNQTLDLAPQQSAVFGNSRRTPKITIPTETAPGTYYLIASFTSRRGAIMPNVISPALTVFSGFGSSRNKGDTAANRAANYVSTASTAKANPLTPFGSFTDQEAETFISNQEGGAILHAYLDSAGIPTIGVGLALQYFDRKGRLIDSPYAENLMAPLGLTYTFDQIVQQAYLRRPPDILTLQQANEVFAQAYGTAKTNAETAVSGLSDLGPNAEIATIDMSYNLGLTNLEQFGDMIADLNAGDVIDAAIASMDSLRAIQIPNRAAADFDYFVAGKEAEL